MTLYDDLGVTKDAAPEQIKAAFRAKAKENHPDTGDNPDPDAFNRVARAYRILRDAASRQKYDQTGSEDESCVIIDAVEATAMQMLSACFDRVMSDDDALSKDIPKLIIKHLSEIREEQRNMLSEGQRQYGKTERAISKLKRTKGNDVDYLANLLADRARKIEAAIDRAKADLNAADRALEMMDQGYQFDADYPPPPPAFAGSSLYTTGGIFGSRKTSIFGFNV